MSGLRKGLLVGALHVAIVAGLGVKFSVDRATLPRVWARTAPVDPYLPVRGRYVRLRLEVAAPDVVFEPFQPFTERNEPTARALPVALEVRNGQLVAVPAPPGSRVRVITVEREGQPVPVLNRPVAYFIPEHAPDPSRLAPGEELWVEVTVPRRGAPRPIRLGVRKDGVLTPR